MKIQIDNSFIHDTKKAPDKIRKSIPLLINELRQANALADIRKLKKLSGYKNAYRIRIDQYRIGLYLEGETVILSRVLSRKDIYKFFPK